MIHLGDVVDTLPQDFIGLVAVVEAVVTAASNVVASCELHEVRVME